MANQPNDRGESEGKAMVLVCWIMVMILWRGKKSSEVVRLYTTLLPVSVEGGLGETLRLIYLYDFCRH